MWKSMIHTYRTLKITTPTIVTSTVISLFLFYLQFKFYFSVNAPLDKVENATEVENELDQKIKNIIVAMQLN